MGTILQLNVKSKNEKALGLPKNPVSKAQVSTLGMQGDYNYYRHDHLENTVDQALLIMPIEKIKELNSEGWPIQPGDIGENITSEGIAYDEFQPGSKFLVGGVTFEISYACDPCKNLYQLPYVGKEKGPEFVKTMMRRRGWYAKVLQEGEIEVGNKIEKV